MAMAGRPLWIGRGGIPTERLAGRCDAVAHGAWEARQLLMQLSSWSVQALRATARIHGDNPAGVIAARVARPPMSTVTIEREAGISRDTSERLRARMAAMALRREIIGLWVGPTEAETL